MSDLRSHPTDVSDGEPTLVERSPTFAAAEQHLANARDLARNGNPARAFTELLQSLRAAPPSAALCSETIRLARRAGLEVAAAAALQDVWATAPAADQPAFHRALARLWRRQGNLPQARLHLYQLLSARPADGRAQAALAHLLAREGRHQELCQALARAGAQADAHRRFALAHRLHLTRARRLSASAGELREAADAFAAAAESARRAGDREGVLAGRMLALQAMTRDQAPAELTARGRERLLDAAGDLVGAAEAERAVSAIAAGGPDAARLLIERAVLAEARGAQAEATALWEAAVDANPAATDAAERLARLLTARRAWAELAEFRGRQAHLARAPADKLRALRQRAEVLHRHLRDPGGAAQAWADIFQLTGDAAALHAQLEHLERAGGEANATAALDRAVSQAADLDHKATALRVRAERHLGQRRFAHAAADLGRLAQLAPLSPAEQRGLCAARAEEGDPEAIHELWRLAAQVKPGEPGRAELFRRLARLSAWPLGDAERSRSAWAEVLVDSPGDPEAEERLLQLARARNRPDELVPILRARVSRYGRGPEARQARRDLARLLERLGRDTEGLEVWQAAVQAEPSDAEAQLALGERLERRGELVGATQAFEAAAHGLEDPRAQGEAWAHLAHLSQALDAPARAQDAALRARSLGVAFPQDPTSLQALEPRAEVTRVGRPPAPPTLLPVPKPPSARPPTVPARKVARVSTGRRQRTDPSRIPLAKAAPPALLEALEHTPLDRRVHEKLAFHFEGQGDVLRSSLFTEVAHALDGDPDAEPLAPKATLSSTALSALRHPDLKDPWVDALHLSGEVLVAQLAPTRRNATPFALGAGKGAASAAEALLHAVRILGQRAPDVVIAAAEGPPFALEHAQPIRLAVGRGAVKHPWNAAELRFFAARALYSLAPELLALRLLDPDPLAAGMEKLASAVGLPKNRQKGLITKLTPKAREIVIRILESADHAPQWEKLMLAARHSANRAGLMAAGGVAPALRALGAKRAGEAERGELVKFAVSDRVVRMRNRR